MEYLEIGEIGNIRDVKVQCLAMSEFDADKWWELDGGCCEYYNCFFQGHYCDNTACCAEDRSDKTSVYFKKIK